MRCTARSSRRGSELQCPFHLQLIASQIGKHLFIASIQEKLFLNSLSYGSLNQNSQMRNPGKASAFKTMFAKTRVFSIPLGFHAKHNLHFQDSRNCDHGSEDVFNLLEIILTAVVLKMQHDFLSGNRDAEKYHSCRPISPGSPVLKTTLI